MRERTRNPIVSRNLADRTGSSGILRRAYAEIRRRFAGLQIDVLRRAFLFGVSITPQ